MPFYVSDVLLCCVSVCPHGVNYHAAIYFVSNNSVFYVLVFFGLTVIGLCN